MTPALARPVVLASWCPATTGWVEQAVVRLRRTAPAPADPPSGNPFIVLADVDFTAAMSNSNVTNTSGRGGVRLEILSDDVRALLSGGPSPATLTGITLSPPGPLSLTVGNTATLTATGHFDTGPDRPLSRPATDCCGRVPTCRLLQYQRWA